MIRTLLSCLLLPCVGALAASASTANPAIEADDRYRYTILSQDVDAVLQDFGASLGVSMTIDEAVKGRVTNFRGVFSPSEFLDRLTREQALEWYYDGSSVHVTPVSKNRSVVVDFRKVSPQLLDETLASLGLQDDRFEIRATPQSGIGVLTGPPRYIELIENAFALLEQRRVDRDGRAAEPSASNILIIRGDSTQVWRGKNAIDDGSEAAAVVRDEPEPERGAEEATAP